MTKLSDEGVRLDITPTGALGLPRWQYELRAACACLETDQPLSSSYRAKISEMLGRHQAFIETAIRTSASLSTDVGEGL